MNRQPVQSSNLASVGYDQETQTLEIEFLDGKIYQYFDVPEMIYQGLLSADSPGGYMWQHIRGKYRYAQV